MEFWFAIIKVIAVVAMIILAAGCYSAATAARRRALATCGSGWFPAARFHRAGDDDGDYMFSFGGLELVGITAAEADNPSKVFQKRLTRLSTAS